MYVPGTVRLDQGDISPRLLIHGLLKKLKSCVVVCNRSSFLHHPKIVRLRELSKIKQYHTVTISQIDSAIIMTRLLCGGYPVLGHDFIFDES